MKHTHLTLILLLAANTLVSATEWHVSGTGNDTNDGKTPKTAFRSLQKAADLVEPGDVVLVGDGEYSSPDRADGSAVLAIRKSGKADAWITWKAVAGSRPVVRPKGWAGILITGSYHIIDGLNVIGNNDEIVLLHALEDAKKATPDGFYNTNGIFINGRPKGPDEKPHHIIIRNLEVGKCAGGGVTGIETDYLTVEDCKVHENAWFMRFGGSGITTLNNWAFDDAPGYHIIIQRNYVWNNKTMVPWEKIGKLSDGNGIILDVTNQGNGPFNPNADAAVNPKGDQAKPNATTTSPANNPVKRGRPIWKGRALIANNVSAFNGGSGIHTFRTSHVDIINNTTYWNGQNVGYEELFPNNSVDIVILNNIMVPRPGGKVTSNSKNTSIRWDYNLYPLDQNVIRGPHDIIADPLFINVQADPTKGDFRLLKTSSGKDSGTNDIPQSNDITGQKRPKGKGRDRGAFEQ